MNTQTKNDAMAKMDEVSKIVERMKVLVQCTGRVPGCTDLYHQEIQKIVTAVTDLHTDITTHETRMLGLCLPWTEESHGLHYVASSDEGEEIVRKYSCLVHQRDTKFVQDVIGMTK